MSKLFIEFSVILLLPELFLKYHRILSDMWTHSHWAGVNRISRLSPAWKFQLYFTRITDVSPAFCNCQVKDILPSPPKKKQNKQKRRNRNKALFKEKKAPGKTPLYQRSLEHLTTYVWRQSTFTVFLCLSIISSLCIVYNRSARLTLACLTLHRGGSIL